MTQNVLFASLFVHLSTSCQYVELSNFMTYVQEFAPGVGALPEFVEKVVLASILVCYIANWYGVAIMYFYNRNTVSMLTLLNEMYEKKQKSEETKDVFIASMSQEFRNPLNSML
jgi:signal transduction histidine kinase